MAPLFALLAGAVVLVHLAFVLFATTGAALVVRWPRVRWLHIPAVAWAAYIELTGGICPLTPLENDLRARAGLDYYSSDFIARYLLPVLYPEGLTSEAQTAAGIAVLCINAVMYAWVVHRWRRARR
jgi:hypothetical protein